MFENHMTLCGLEKFLRNMNTTLIYIFPYLCICRICCKQTCHFFGRMSVISSRHISHSVMNVIIVEGCIFARSMYQTQPSGTKANQDTINHVRSHNMSLISTGVLNRVSSSSSAYWHMCLALKILSDFVSAKHAVVAIKHLTVS